MYTTDKVTKHSINYLCCSLARMSGLALPPLSRNVQMSTDGHDSAWGSHGCVEHGVKHLDNPQSDYVQPDEAGLSRGLSVGELSGEGLRFSISHFSS